MLADDTKRLAMSQQGSGCCSLGSCALPLAAVTFFPGQQLLPKKRLWLLHGQHHHLPQPSPSPVAVLCSCSERCCAAHPTPPHFSSENNPWLQICNMPLALWTWLQTAASRRGMCIPMDKAVHSQAGSRQTHFLLKDSGHLSHISQVTSSP